MLPDVPSSVAAVFDRFPEQPRLRLLDLRALIFEGAELADAGPLTETLKWGEPAYLTQASKSGTTIRLGWKPKTPAHCMMFVSCQTTLVESYRQDFANAFTYEGNRAVQIPISGDYDQGALQQIIARALTYHRQKTKV